MLLIFCVKCLNNSYEKSLFTVLKNFACFIVSRMHLRYHALYIFKYRHVLSNFLGTTFPAPKRPSIPTIVSQCWGHTCGLSKRADFILFQLLAIFTLFPRQWSKMGFFFINNACKHKDNCDPTSRQPPSCWL